MTFKAIPPKQRQPGEVIGHKRPKLRSINDLKNFMLESIELHSAGQITAAEMRQRTASAKDTAEVHAAIKLMELQGVSFDMDADPTGLEYSPVVRRKVTRRSGVTLKGPIDEVTPEEVQEASGDTLELDALDVSPSLAERLAFGEEESDPAPGPEEDEIPW